MSLLNIMTTIFEYKHFNTIIISVSLSLVALFVVVLILGLRDSRKKTKKPIEIIKEFEEITFKEDQEELIINEEITLEMPSITKNLEDFKKSIEEEIKQEQLDSNVQVEQSEDKSLMEDTQPVKILNINEIEDTVIINTVETKEEKEESIETIIEEEPIEMLEEEKSYDIKEESIIEVQKLDIPLLAPDEDDELLFKTMTALHLPQDD